MGALTIDVIEDVGALDSLSGEWTALASRASVSSPFLSFEWVSVYWAHYGNNRRLLVLTARDAAGRLVGIAPLCEKEVRVLSIPIFRRAEFVGEPFSDLLDFVIERGAEQDVVEAFLEALLRRGIDVLDLREVAEDSPTRSLAASGEGFEVAELPSGALPYISTTTGWPAYLDSLGKSTQRHFKYYSNRISKKYRTEFQVVADPEGIAHALDGFFALYEKRFAGLPVAAPSYRAFRSDIARRFADRGWMRLFLLTLDGRLVAAEWCFSWGRALLSYNACYDSDWSKDGVTIVLQGNLIRHAMEEGFEEYNLLRGEEPYKRHWTSAVRTNYRLTLRRPSLRLSAIEAARRVRDRWGTRATSVNASADPEFEGAPS